MKRKDDSQEKEEGIRKENSDHLLGVIKRISGREVKVSSQTVEIQEEEEKE